MRFRILGPLRVRCADGQPLLLRPQQARVLGMLLLAPNQVVGRQRLMAELWDDNPPATAKTQIQNCISALRRGLTGLIVADGPGYRIRVDDGELDAQVFQGLVAAAHDLHHSDTPEAVARLRSALGLWRGPALAGSAGRAIEAAAARLDEQRIAAHEFCADLELRLGRHHELIGELGELVAAYPLRERLVGQLMLALHRSGRRADALTAYRRLRARLADELGLDPGPALANLHTAILRDGSGEPAPSATPPPRKAAVREPAQVVPRQLPAGVRHFVGRTVELKELTRLVDEAGLADGRIVITTIDGTAGVGKTALAVHWAHQIAPRFPDGQLYANLRGFDPSGSPTPPAEAIRGFLEALGVPDAQVPATLDAQAALYRSLLAGRRVLVVLDNAATVEQVRPLLPGSASCQVLVTSRNQLSGLVATEGAHPVTLPLMSTVEAHELLVRHLGPERLAADADAVDALITGCARLPLALSIVAARAATHPAFPLATFATELADAHGRLDVLDPGDQTMHVRAAFSWSYRHLGVPAARLFRLLGLHPGADLTLPAAASLAGVPAAEVRPLLVELTRTHLLTEHAPGRYGFHDLLRTYAGELAGEHDTGADRRAALRRLLDHYLHTAAAAAVKVNPERDPIELATPAAGVTVTPVADYAQGMLWFASERPTLLAAVDEANRADMPVHAWQLAWTMVSFLDRRGHWHDQVTVQQAGLAGARRAGDLAGQALMHRMLGRAYTRMLSFEAADVHLRRALDLFGALEDHTGEAHTHLNRAWVFERQERYREALDETRQGFALFESLGHEVGQANTLNAMGWYLAKLGEHRQALEYCERALAMHLRMGDRSGAANAWDSVGFAYHNIGEHDRAIECYERSLGLDRELSDRYSEAATLGRLGDTQRTAGDTRAAAASWRRAMEIFDQLGHVDADLVRAKLDALGVPA